MNNITELIRLNPNFQKSVNLILDLNHEKRVEHYIPTASAVSILKWYFETVIGKNEESATILIGPYGKGKSHLLLVLLSILGANRRNYSSIIDKLEQLDPDLKKAIRQIEKNQMKYLPVLISPSQDSLSRDFCQALRQALIREKLEKLAPESYYTEAIRKVAEWKKSYPGVYEQLQKLLAQQKKCPYSDADILKSALRKQEPDAMRLFQTLFPKLTGGMEFEPMLQTEPLLLYRQINRTLIEEYGYSGMFLVFDEFSKYIEGHGKESFASDMKILQDICELCNHSKGQMLIVMVAHKSIHEYSRSIDPSIKNAFRGVEGRLKEIEFVVSAQSNYELIADSIVKMEPRFSQVVSAYLRKKSVQEQHAAVYALPAFSNTFYPESFEQTVVKGCFPLKPLTAYALLRISEKVAQNERTVFTFLTGTGQGTLSWLLGKNKTRQIAMQSVYDYFKGLFRENVDQQQIHNEWIKAESAIAKADTKEEAVIIKILALIRIIHQPEELPATEEVLSLASDFNREQTRKAIGGLQQKNLVLYRSRFGVYAFTANIHLNLEKEIEKRENLAKGHIDYCQILKKVSELDYELPKQYNQEFAITRYFQYEYMNVVDFLKLKDSHYLFEEQFADGKILILFQTEKIHGRAVEQHFKQLGEKRLLVILSAKAFTLEKKLLKYEALEGLMNDTAFLEENEVLLPELLLAQEDLLFELNAELEKDYLPGTSNACIISSSGVYKKGLAEVEFNQLLSDILKEYYPFSPKVNHELLNVENIGSQYLKARTQVMDSILKGDDGVQFLTGTKPEAMVYRAAFVHTQSDEGVRKIAEEVDLFFQQCAGKRVSFLHLYQKLQGREYGARKGIIPLFLAMKLKGTDDTAVIYLRNKELGVTAEILNNVNLYPEQYELYLEPETVEKNMYLDKLQELFAVSGTVSASGRASTSSWASVSGRVSDSSRASVSGRVSDSGRASVSGRVSASGRFPASGRLPALDLASTSGQDKVNVILVAMQKWYRSLPQYAMVSTEYVHTEEIRKFRNEIKKAEVNPRELLFDQFPLIFGEPSYAGLAQRIQMVKQEMDDQFSRLLEQTIDVILMEFAGGINKNLKACLKGWKHPFQNESHKHIYHSPTNAFLQYISEMETNDSEEIARRLAYLVTDIYMEDWNDATLQQFQEKLHEVRTEVENSIGKEEDPQGGNQLIFRNSEGKMVEKYYQADISDSTSQYLKNMIDEALDDFGESLETNQKVAVLIQTIEEILTGKRSDEG